ncbi:MAG: hypothetical protein AAB686_02900 [Patescibacteria group bacterium]
MDNPQETQTLPKNRQISPKIVLFVLIIVAVAVVGYYWVERQKNQIPSITPPVSQKPLSRIINVEGGGLPLNLSKDIVLEKDVQVLQGYYTRPFPYNKELTMYQVQSSFRFVSKNGPDENFVSYSKYLKANGWQITGSIDKKETKRLTAIKGPDQLNVTIDISPLSKETVVGLFNIHIGLYSALNKVQTE